VSREVAGDPGGGCPPSQDKSIVTRVESPGQLAAKIEGPEERPSCAQRLEPAFERRDPAHSGLGGRAA